MPSPRRIQATDVSSTRYFCNEPGSEMATVRAMVEAAGGAEITLAAYRSPHPGPNGLCCWFVPRLTMPSRRTRPMTRSDMSEEQADVVVVGAGPAGATTACWLADQGLSVALLEKGTFPRDKVCGDGLTPRATKQLLRLGIDVSEEAGWLHNKGLRVYGARAEPFELPWPTLAEFPSFGLVRKRADFDELLADRAVQKGATLHQQANVTGVVVDERTERVTGVTTK